LPEGYAIKTNLFSESILLFSNGTTATVLENSKLRLDKFIQAPFEAQGNAFGQLAAEPSASEVSINMEIGSLVVQTKKLNKSSSFQITTPTGTAGIRGTQFQMAMSPNTGMKLDVAESQVAFTPVGNAQPVLVGPGRGLDASASGSLKQRSISPSAAQTISAKNSVASSACAAVPVTTAKQATKKAQQADDGQDSGDDQEGGSDGDEPAQKEDSTQQDSDSDKQAKSSNNKAGTDFLSRSGLVSQRSVSAAENQMKIKNTEDNIAQIFENLKKTYPNADPNDIYNSLLDVINNNPNLLNQLLGDQGSSVSSVLEEVQNQTQDSLDSDDDETIDVNIPLPPNVTPPDPPSFSPGMGKSVVYSFEPTDTIVSIGLYEEGIPVPLEVSFLNLDDLNTENDFELIFSKFENWDATDEVKIINAIGLDVFIHEIGINPSKYDNFNVAIQHAIGLAQSFLEEVTLTTLIPADKVRNARGLIDEFANNPYAFEFAKLLARHGAISNPSNQAATDNLLSILGSEKLANPDYLTNLLVQTLLPGQSYNSEELNGGLIGARNASIDPKTAKQLQVQLQDVDALVGGDIFIGAGATIDVSTYLPAKGENDGTKIFTIAAAKDLSLHGDVTFKNDNHAEDHALSIGSAGDLNIQAGSKIHYEGSNLGIGTAGDLKLLDVEIDVGGNLAIGSLGDLDIEFTESGSKLFSVGRYSDRDNVYLYANDLIKVQGLQFNDRAREIYMEAITVNLKNVNFPEYSEVMLRSQKGTLDFGTFSSPTIGGVNLTNVKHLGISPDRSLQQSDFSGSNGKWNSTTTHNNGTPALRVRAFSNGNAGSGVN